MRDAGAQQYRKQRWPGVAGNVRGENRIGGWCAAMHSAPLRAATRMAEGMRAKIRVRHVADAMHRHGLRHVRDAALRMLARVGTAHCKERKQTDNDKAAQEIHAESNGRPGSVDRNILSHAVAYEMQERHRTCSTYKPGQGHKNPLASLCGWPASQSRVSEVQLKSGAIQMPLSSLRVATLLSALLIAACSNLGNSTAPATSTATSSSASSDPPSHAQLEQDARKALNTLYTTTPHAKDLSARANGILVFPSILKAGLLIGGSGGNGVLFSRDGRVLGYYNASSLSYGLQAGAQSFSEVMFLMTPSAQQYLDSSDGWSIGAGPSVVVASSGTAQDYSSTTTRSDVYAFIFGQSGLMAGMGVTGQKITKLNP
jgi:lipid-binding SYLF domain-containing protein